MWKLIASLALLVLAVLHAPRPAQALFAEYVPSTFFDLGANEPVILLLVGVALLGVSRAAAARSRVAKDERLQAPPRAPSRCARFVLRAASV